MFNQEIRIKQGLPDISFCPLRILYNNSHYNSNIFGNKCCRCNEGSLYVFFVSFYHSRQRKQFLQGDNVFEKKPTL